uniref:Uncharacterized protein n=1 Tax=Anguilla anguilla TaxID=7936 RepID=A0A0E9U207_ANGAN
MKPFYKTRITLGCKICSLVIFQDDNALQRWELPKC